MGFLLLATILAAAPPPRTDVVHRRLAQPAHGPEFRLGGLLASQFNVGQVMAAAMAVAEININTDLLPHHTLRFALRDSACDEDEALLGAIHLAKKAFDGLGAQAML